MFTGAVSVLLLLILLYEFKPLVSLRASRREAGPSLHNVGNTSGSECQVLAETHGRQLVESKELALFEHRDLSPLAISCSQGATKQSKLADSGEPECSPVCSQQLDVVVVLGLAQDGKPLDAEAANHLRQIATGLTEHFDLNRSYGSLFGFADASHGISETTVVAELGDDRAALKRALLAWAPEYGHAPPLGSEIQGLGNSPALLAMLQNARSGAHRTLLVLGGKNDPFFVAHGGTQVVFANLPDMSTTLTNTSQMKTAIDKLNWDIMEALLQTCPAVALDPSLACGRMRWGSGSGEGVPDA